MDKWGNWNRNLGSWFLEVKEIVKVVAFGDQFLAVFLIKTQNGFHWNYRIQAILDVIAYSHI